MQKKRIAILGAGISGLTAAWKLSQNPDLEILILEKSKEAGGWLGTDFFTGYHIEKGARTFKTSRSSHLLSLIHALGLKDHLIFSSSDSHKRYLWIKGKLVQAPSFSLLRKMGASFFTEWCVPPSKEEETVWDFACRRFNKNVAQYLFDPLVLGIFGGDSKTLSLNACFPFLKELENTHGSLTKALIKNLFIKKTEGSLFSFKGGVQTLINTLVAKTQAKIYYEQDVQKILFSEQDVQIFTETQVFTVDYVFNALPTDVSGKLFHSIDAEISSLFLSIPRLTLTVIQLCYDKEVLLKKGFGYLVPSVEKENILGVIFDSSIFPEHNQKKQETRVTVMMSDEKGKTEETLKKEALEAVQRHLQIEEMPSVLTIEHKVGAIPQYTLGHQARIALLKDRVFKDFPRLHLIGSYLNGASVNECIREALTACQIWESKHKGL